MNIPNFSLQPVLQNEVVALFPLLETDFDDLYQVASDPAIWAQHPNPDRWKKEVFKTFFEGALQSQGAFKIVDQTTNETIGSTRMYDYHAADNSILIGYTFYATKCWGKGINLAAKALMLNYLFQFVDKVSFHIGAQNMRSQVAIERLGALKMGEREITYYGEASKLNFVYTIAREDWIKRLV